MKKLKIEQQEIFAENIYEPLIEHFPDIIHSVNAEGIIVLTNQKACALLGYAKDELIGMHISNIYADDVMQEVNEGFDSLILSGEQCVDSKLISKIGEEIPVEVRSFSIYDEDNKFIRTFSIIRDLRQLKNLQDTLVKSERLGAIGEMAAGIVHDINNPLMVILSNVDLIDDLFKNHHDDIPQNLYEVIEHMQDITRASKSIENLARHLRSFSRGVTEDKANVDLAGAMVESLLLVKTRIDKENIKLTCDFTNEKTCVWGHANHIEQVLSNLMSNACDAMEGCEDKKLTLCLEPGRLNEKEAWVIKVTDTGMGVPKEKQKYIFNSFFTTKEKGKGTGLGLSITRGIVDELKGTVKVESEPGSDTTFIVTLPAKIRKTA